MYRRRLSALAVVLVLCASRAAAQQVPDVRPCETALPANIEGGVLQQQALDLLQRSATFRQQCRLIAASRILRVTLAVGRDMEDRARAQTVMHRYQAGAIRAEVTLGFSEDFLELLAHEFEHILEQVDHVDLRGLAGVRGSGVHQVESDLFETERAQRVGRMVAAEVRDRRERRPFATD
jgi:hypothetical protein